MDKDKEKRLKILLVGDPGVGKTSLMTRYVNGKFDDNCATTIGVEFKEKIIIINSIKYIITVLDTPGQVRYQSITRSYFRSVQGFFIVFDLTDIDSFNNLENWIKIIKEVVEEPNIIILANKVDLLDNKVGDNQLKEFSLKNQIKIIIISVKENANIDKAFNEMINLIYNNPVNKRDTFIMTKDIHKTKKKKHFC